MKKVFILATAAIVALASCAKTQVVYNDQPEEIAFKQITGAMTKAPTALGDAVQMGVFAEYNTNANYFDNVPFAKRDGETVWGAVDALGAVAPKYWPFEGSLDFTIYAPYAEGKAEYNNSNKTLTVSTVTAGENILYGAERYLNKTKADVNMAVNLKHACAKITVILKSNVNNLYTVTALSIADALTSGNYSVNYTSGAVVTATGTSAQLNYTVNQPLTTSDYTCDVKYVLPADQTSFNITFSQTDITTPFTKKINLSDEWTANKHYIYTITIDANEILLTPQVVDWDTPSVETGYGNADLI